MKTRVPASQLRQMTDIDYPRHVALVAEVWQGLGLGARICDEPGDATLMRVSLACSAPS